MRLFLEEAALYLAETAQSGLPVTDTAEFFDRHPEVRLMLEDTWSDPHGRVYREIPGDHQSRWPAHLARTFKIFLKIGQNPSQVFRLLDLLHEIEASSSVVRMVIVRCRKRESLTPALEYLENLASELRAVTESQPEEEIPLGVIDPRCRPKMSSGEISSDCWYLPDTKEAEDCSRPTSSCYRPDLLHDPDSFDDEDWVESQPQAWRNLYRAIQKADSDRLVIIKEHLLFDGKSHWNHDQLQVLWTAYNLRRNKIRGKAQAEASRKLGLTASKLIHRVHRIRSEREAGWVGYHLHKAMKGEINLPGAVSPAEWAVVFEAYRNRKAELLRPPCQPTPSLCSHPVAHPVPAFRG